MKDAQYYDALRWEVRIERDLHHDGTVYYIACHLEFGDIAGPVGTGASPEEALTELHEARQSLIAVLLERGDSIPEPGPVKTASAYALSALPGLQSLGQAGGLPTWVTTAKPREPTRLTSGEVDLSRQGRRAVAPLVCGNSTQSTW